MRKRVVITGIGALSSAGQGREALWKAMVESTPLMEPITRFDTSLLKVSKSGQVPDFMAEDWMTKILARQTDRSTQFALAATLLGLEDGGIVVNEENCDRIGMMVGHALGGMEFSEPNLYNSWFVGPDAVSPYQAIAWFYAAAQGQTSIATGLKGYSKSFVSDRLSGLHALGHAYHMIEEGKMDICVAGGTEAPLSPFICLSMETTGKLGRDFYAPFTEEAEGLVLGEGACFLVLESLDSALEREAEILAEIKGFAMSTDCEAGHYDYAGEEAILQSMIGCRKDSGVDRIDHLFADGAATAEGDRAEKRAIEGFKEYLSPDYKVSVPKTIVGDMYAAGAPLQTAVAALSLHHQTRLPLETGEKEVDGIPHLKEAESGDIASILVNGKGIGGLCSSLLICQYK